MELLLLPLLRTGQLNSWDTMQRIELVTGEVLSVILGARYPSHHRMEERGQIYSAWGSRKTGKALLFDAGGGNHIEAWSESLIRGSTLPISGGDVTGSHNNQADSQDNSTSNFKQPPYTCDMVQLVMGLCPNSNGEDRI
jgi:hypothetical protein